MTLEEARCALREFLSDRDAVLRKPPGPAAWIPGPLPERMRRKRQK